jgi:two-component system, OmpR family, sensor kinase
VIARFNRLPVRWRLAVTSAGLTFVILLLFAVVIGIVTARQMRAGFDDELRSAAADLQQQIRVTRDFDGDIVLSDRGRALADVSAAGNSVVRILGVTGHQVFPTSRPLDLGPPNLGNPVDRGDYRVVTRPLFAGQFDAPVAFVQYGRDKDTIDHTVARLKLFLAFGVLVGTGLALLAGFAVARRAMAPIASLTAAAQTITRTRDPSVALPKQDAEDEVAELARTLDEMLHALDDARAETQAALDRQREFVADASHELRTPLTSILANLELLEADLQGEDQEIAASALRSSRRMRRLVADLLLLARADAGRRPARRPTDLASVLRDAAAEVAALGGDHDLTIDAAGGVVVDGSPDDLHRMALNLLENAATHTPAGTTIRGAIWREGDTAVLVVEDEGPGIPEHLRARVFERFVRGEGENVAGGSGLGLAIVRAVAETHGGTVELTERHGGGARFEVRLPAAPIPAPAPEAEAAERAPAEGEARSEA